MCLAFRLSRLALLEVGTADQVAQRLVHVVAEDVHPRPFVRPLQLAPGEEVDGTTGRLVDVARQRGRLPGDTLYGHLLILAAAAAAPTSCAEDNIY